MKPRSSLRTLLLIFIFTFTASCVSAKAPLYTSLSDDDSNEYLVVFKQDGGGSGTRGARSPFKLLSVLWGAAQHSLEVLHEFRIRNWLAVHVRADAQALDVVLQLPEVLLVESNRKVSASLGWDSSEVTDWFTEEITPKVSPSGPPTTYSKSTMDPGPATCVRQNTGADLWGLTRINTHELPDFSEAGYDFSAVDDGRGVDVYVVDTGIDINHEELKGRATWGMTASGVLHEGDVDLSGHGTHVAGIIAGTTFGVAKHANVIGVKVLDRENRGTIADVLQGIQWIVQNELIKPHPRKSVVNLSLGSTGIVYSLDAAIQEAVADGIPFVVAAGNDYKEACSDSPARIASVITVGATDPEDKITVFSNYGPCVNILAPGQFIRSAYIGSPNATEMLSGTSQAAPHVSGVLARHLSAVYGGTAPSPAQLLSLITDTATTGSIIFEGLWETTTPDRLLYKACDGYRLPGSDPSTPKIPNNTPHTPHNPPNTASSLHMSQSLWALLGAAIFSQVWRNL